MTDQRPAAPKASRGLSAKKLVHDLRKELLALERGAFFGFEDEILARLGVSRPTLRQAARVLEHDQLLSVRRGMHGGYYVSRPEVASVVAAASLYLHGRGTRLRDLNATSRACVIMMVRLAAQSEDEATREILHEQLAAYLATDHAANAYTEFLRDETAIVATLARLAGNPPLELVINILYGCGLGANNDRIFEGRPDRIAASSQLRARLVEAVLMREPDMAEILSSRLSGLMQTYLDEDGGGVAQPDKETPMKVAVAQRGPARRA